jgi:DNA-binding transcriptional ArsR family regulator
MPISSAEMVADRPATPVPDTADKAAPPADDIDAARLRARAQAATRFLKTLANHHRLMILCHLVEGEHAVGELEEQLGIQQAHLSQQLARLRRDGLVRTRRESRTVFYSLGSEEAREMIGTLYRLFCRERPPARHA